jgi:pseudouridine-5'-phosphate glycosidase
MITELLNISSEVKEALEEKLPIVALESTVISHGLEYPFNLEAAEKIEAAVRKSGAVPAFIAILNGQIKIGCSQADLQFLASSKQIRKVSVRDLPIVISQKSNGATTVAATSLIAHKAGIEIFSTGGIGGAHRNSLFDISADLPVLSKTPITVVCSGAKAILDLNATRECLETNGVTVVGYKCDEFPAFYTRKSGLSVDHRADSIEEISELIKTRDLLGLNSAVLVTVPIPKEFELENTKLERLMEIAFNLAERNEIKGKEITPFLLKQLSELTEGKSVKANIALLENNARTAGKIATMLSKVSK